MAVLAHQHEAQAQHDFALAVGGDRAAANLVADRHLGHVATRIGTPSSAAIDDLADLRRRSSVRPSPCTSSMPLCLA